MWHQKTRTLLTTLGVVFGSFVLAASLSIGQGVQETIERESHRSDYLRRIDVQPEWRPTELAKTEDNYSQLRGLIWEWWLLWLLSCVTSVFASITSGAQDAQGIANNTVAIIVAYLLALVAAFATERLFGRPLVCGAKGRNFSGVHRRDLGLGERFGAVYDLLVVQLFDRRIAEVQHF